MAIFTLNESGSMFGENVYNFNVRAIYPTYHIILEQVECSMNVIASARTSILPHSPGSIEMATESAHVMAQRVIQHIQKTLDSSMDKHRELYKTNVYYPL